MKGAQALTNPVADGIPVLSLPPEVLGEPRAGKKTIPLSCLGQEPPSVYRLAPGDVLGVWIEGVLGEEKAPLPVQGATQTFIREQRRLPPGIGYPVRVDEDGTITVPQLDPIAVCGLSVTEVRDVLRSQLVSKGILKEGNKRIIVDLLSPREYRIVVMRQEATASTISTEGLFATTKRGTGHEVFLPAYENDVLHALAQTGGLPGLDSADEVIIHRVCKHCGPLAAPGHPGAAPVGPMPPGPEVIDIPLRWRPGHPLPFHPQDIVLQTGDVVYLKPRETDVYFTTGLLPAGEHILPRDTDLDVIQAILRSRGPMVNGGQNASNLNGTLILPGIANPSPRLLTVVRKLPDGCTIPIRIDLHCALRDARQRINVLPGDVLVLQDVPEDALARYLYQSFFNFEIYWEVIRSPFAKGISNVGIPNEPSTAPSTFSSVTLP